MGELATAPEDLERYVKDGFQLTTAPMVDRLTAVVDDLGEEPAGQVQRMGLPGKTIGCRCARSGPNGLPAGGARVATADGEAAES